MPRDYIGDSSRLWMHYLLLLTSELIFHILYIVNAYQWKLLLDKYRYTDILWYNLYLHPSPGCQWQMKASVGIPYKTCNNFRGVSGHFSKPQWWPGKEFIDPGLFCFLAWWYDWSFDLFGGAWGWKFQKHQRFFTDLSSPNLFKKKMLHPSSSINTSSPLFWLYPSRTATDSMGFFPPTVGTPVFFHQWYLGVLLGLWWFGFPNPISSVESPARPQVN